MAFKNLKYYNDCNKINFTVSHDRIIVTWYSDKILDTLYMGFDFSFFEDFETYLKMANECVLKNNEKEKEKYNTYLKEKKNHRNRNI